jgi:hypothetical protein
VTSTIGAKENRDQGGGQHVLDGDRSIGSMGRTTARWKVLGELWLAGAAVRENRPTLTSHDDQSHLHGSGVGTTKNRVFPILARNRVGTQSISG